MINRSEHPASSAARAVRSLICSSQTFVEEREIVEPEASMAALFRRYRLTTANR
jgi:hypothetical protein